MSDLAKALTICQPYAHLIVRGEKLVENRNWPTNYRGRLAIHAGKSRDWMDDMDEEEFIASGDPMVFGAIVGSATLIDCLHIDAIERGDYDSRLPWLRAHEHTGGPWCWVLDRVIRYAHPLPWKGAQGLWTLPASMLALRHVGVIAGEGS